MWLYQDGPKHHRFPVWTSPFRINKKRELVILRSLPIISIRPTMILFCLFFVFQNTTNFRFFSFFSLSNTGSKNQLSQMPTIPNSNYPKYQPSQIFQIPRPVLHMVRPSTFPWYHLTKTPTIQNSSYPLRGSTEYINLMLCLQHASHKCSSRQE